ncbi:MAG TPA: hypothetical protein VL069_14985, partial [Opitutus sp.]|nr:hypothetical protein [Opitutus sp.]
GRQQHQKLLGQIRNLLMGSSNGDGALAALTVIKTPSSHEKASGRLGNQGDQVVALTFTHAA